MIKKSKHSSKTIRDAVTYARATSQREASIKFDIPVGTISRWVCLDNQGKLPRGYDIEVAPDAPLQTLLPDNGPGPKTVEAAKELISKAQDDMLEDAKVRISMAQDRLMGLINKAIDKIEKTLDDGAKKSESNSYWLATVTTTLSQAIEKYQLISGLPTAVQKNEQAGAVEVVSRRELDITQRVLTNTDLREQSRDLFRRAARTDMGS